MNANVGWQSFTVWYVQYLYMPTDVWYEQVDCVYALSKSALHNTCNWTLGVV